MYSQQLFNSICSTARKFRDFIRTSFCVHVDYVAASKRSA